MEDLETKAIEEAGGVVDVTSRRYTKTWLLLLSAGVEQGFDPTRWVVTDFFALDLDSVSARGPSEQWKSAGEASSISSKILSSSPL